MRPFRATYTPRIAKYAEGCPFPEMVDDTDNARTVLIVAILMEGGEDSSLVAGFIDSDYSLKSAWLDRFTDCLSEWRE